MWIKRLKLVNFRILEKVEIELCPGLNFFYGDNGSGKSSLFEAVVALSRGSVPDGKGSDRVGPSLSGWSVEAFVSATASVDSSPVNVISISWDGHQKRQRDGKTESAFALSKTLIASVLSWNTHGLLENGPDERRKLIDWVLFHVEQDYPLLWTRWRRLLRQRNQALTSNVPRGVVVAWDEQLAEAAEQLTDKRQKLIPKLNEACQHWIKQFEGVTEIALFLKTGWHPQFSYREVLESEIERDQRRGLTGHGPQRADLVICSGSRRATELSRGQQKLLLGVLLLTASEYVFERTGEWPVLMVDDFGADLAQKATEQLAEAVKQYRGQILIAEHTHNAALWVTKNDALFHVEHGHISRAVK